MKTKNIFMIVLSTLLLLMLLISTKSYAVLQSNGGTVETKDIGSWMSQIRNMETIGGSLGLSETFNDNLTSSSKSNNLDCHMEKNTEYGAMAILSASSYGNPSKIENGGTTTGNKSGVVINLNKEWVAAGTIGYSSTYANASDRYKNLYSSNGQFVIYEHKSGDAINETTGWHGSGASTWISCKEATIGTSSSEAAWAPNIAGLLRSYSGSIFSYYGYGWNSTYVPVHHLETWDAQHTRDALYTNRWASRAVIVVGEGF